jgi:hypothetical protein
LNFSVTSLSLSAEADTQYHSLCCPNNYPIWSPNSNIFSNGRCVLNLLITSGVCACLDTSC